MQKVSGRKLPRFSQVLYFGKILSSFEKKLFVSSVLLLIVGLFWGGYVVASNYRVQIPAVSGVYTEAVIGSLKSINPLFAPLSDIDMDLTSLVYSGLLRYDREQRLVSDIAVNYEVSEDKKIYTFYLKKDVLWHDLEPLTAHDVAYTIELIQDPNVGSPLLVSFQGVVVQVVDDYTIKFVLQEPFRSFLSSLTVGILPEHVWREIPAEQIRLAQRNLQPIGTGPFKLEKIVKNDTGYIYRCELKRFEEYYRQPSFIKEFVFQFFPDFESVDGAINAIREQKVDGLSFVPLSLRDRIKRKHINLNTLQLPQYTALFFNKDKGDLVGSKEARIALQYALDKERVLNESLEGEGKILYTPVLHGYPGYSEEFSTAYSIEEANKLLDKKWDRINAEDYRNQVKEKLINEQKERIKQEKLEQQQEVTEEVVEEGESEVETVDVEEEVNSDDLSEEILLEIENQLNLELSEAQLFYRKKTDDEILQINLVTADTPEYQKVAQLVAGYWEEIGIKTNIKFIDPKELPRRIIKERDYDVLLYGLILGGDHDQYAFWHSSQIDYPGLNLSRFVSRRADELLKAIREENDEAKLNEHYKELQQLIAEEVPAIFLYTPTYTYALSDKVKGFNVTRISHPSDRFANIIEWYIDTKGVWKFN